MDASRLECEPLVVLNFKEGSLILYSYFRIDNCIKDTLMLLKNILGEPRNKLSIILGDS